MKLHIVYLPSCLDQAIAKGPCDLRVKLPPAHLFTTPGEGITLSLFMDEHQVGKM